MTLSILEEQIIDLRAHAELHDHMLFALFKGLAPASDGDAAVSAFVDHLFNDAARYIHHLHEDVSNEREAGQAFIAAMRRQLHRLRANTLEGLGLPVESVDG
jgi:hypothetical protein